MNEDGAAPCDFADGKTGGHKGGRVVQAPPLSKY